MLPDINEYNILDFIINHVFYGKSYNEMKDILFSVPIKLTATI